MVRQNSGEHSHTIPYISIFITHFLNLPAQNLEILRKLYEDLGLSSAQIEKITESQWPKTTVLTTLKKYGIKRHQMNVSFRQAGLTSLILPI